MSASENKPATALFKKSRRRGGGNNIRKRAAEAIDQEAPAQVQTDAGDDERRSAKPGAGRITAGQSRDGSKAEDSPAVSEPARAVEYHYKRGQDATRTVENEKATEQAAKRQKTGNVTAAGDEQGIYKGLAAYESRIKDDPGAKKTGPFKAPTNVRSTSVFDYQPNVCKDYKETGFCGYGDSCVFLHDRGTYKTGWQLEKEFEESQQGVQRDNEKLWKVDASDDEADKKEEELPFACLICRKPFVKPVGTKCGHYFCEKCALSNYRKTPKCFACGAATGGAFRRAKNIEARLEQQNE
ncbi:RNA-splicing factor [Linderina pennispora]|nr:RNA-splicing factor [Linderina pennispora]